MPINDLYNHLSCYLGFMYIFIVTKTNARTDIMTPFSDFGYNVDHEIYNINDIY